MRDGFLKEMLRGAGRLLETEGSLVLKDKSANQKTLKTFHVLPSQKCSLSNKKTKQKYEKHSSTSYELIINPSDYSSWVT